MTTSQSYRQNYYGWSWFSDVGHAFDDYVSLVSGSYTAVATSIPWDAALWSRFVAEIDGGRPVVLLVDSDGNGATDHFVAAIGYDADAHQYACLDTWDEAVHWYDFAAIGMGQDFGIFGAVALRMADEGTVIVGNSGGSDLQISSFVTFNRDRYDFVALDATEAPDLAFYSAASDPSSGEVHAGAVVDLTMRRMLAPGSYSLGTLRFRPRTPPTLLATRSAATGPGDADGGFTLSAGRLVRTDFQSVVIGADHPSASTGSSAALLRANGDRLALPNPYRPRTPIALELPAVETVDLTLYNVGGQAVRNLLNGHLNAGHHEITWDGRTAAGAEAGAGVYFLRVRIGRTVWKETLILTR